MSFVLTSAFSARSRPSAMHGFLLTVCFHLLSIMVCAWISYMLISDQNTQLGTFYNICLGIYIGVWLIEVSIF